MTRWFELGAGPNAGRRDLAVGGVGHVQVAAVGGDGDVPTVGQSDDRRLPRAHRLAAEHVAVEACRPLDIGGHQEAGDENATGRDGQVGDDVSLGRSWRARGQPGLSAGLASARRHIFPGDGMDRAPCPLRGVQNRRGRRLIRLPHPQFQGDGPVHRPRTQHTQVIRPPSCGWRHSGGKSAADTDAHGVNEIHTKPETTDSTVTLMTVTK